MATLTVYGIPNCNTVKKALHWLDEQGVVYRFHNYKKEGISREKLTNWLAQVPWEKLVNRAGTTWRQLPDAQKASIDSAEKATELMLEKNSVIKRPLIEDEAGTVLALGFDESHYQSTLL
ncbi:arsenate reductase [Rhabdobacter roseus]|uniref:Spx/MgsR family transcriptional regulator n=1 Tax=Rhabdobacter roseus TaxID=1655419 RepID=A0A840TPR1_9BACT|nr:ArsC family reductase [Rhabdobacter roseus]MBB5286316.1 Spx/MgsR family transcriptional regulator [Rhabdobacter roseus]